MKAAELARPMGDYIRFVGRGGFRVPTISDGARAFILWEAAVEGDAPADLIRAAWYRATGRERSLLSRLLPKLDEDNLLREDFYDPWLDEGREWSIAALRHAHERGLDVVESFGIRVEAAFDERDGDSSNLMSPARRPLREEDRRLLAAAREDRPPLPRRKRPAISPGPPPGKPQRKRCGTGELTEDDRKFEEAVRVLHDGGHVVTSRLLRHVSDFPAKEVRAALARLQKAGRLRLMEWPEPGHIKVWVPAGRRPHKGFREAS